MCVNTAPARTDYQWRAVSFSSCVTFHHQIICRILRLSNRHFRVKAPTRAGFCCPQTPISVHIRRIIHLRWEPLTPFKASETLCHFWQPRRKDGHHEKDAAITFVCVFKMVVLCHTVRDKIGDRERPNSVGTYIWHFILVNWIWFISTAQCDAVSSCIHPCGPVELAVNLQDRCCLE